MKPVTSEAYQLMHDGMVTFADLEERGIQVDTKRLAKEIKQTDARVVQMEKELREDQFFKDWRREFGTGMNLGSRPQLAHMLFTIKGHPCTTLTRTGKPSAREEDLDKIDDPFVKKFVRVEKLKKLSGTFLKGVQSEMVDGVLHPFFNLHTTKTYRSSSNAPNFHNFPVRDKDLSKPIRSVFTARKGRYLVEVDYGGIEVRIAECYHKDPTMKKYIEDPKSDMHKDMAAQIYMLKPEQIDKMSRYCAKNMFVFPEFYGDFYIHSAQQMWDACDRHKLRVKLPEDGKEATGILIKEHLKKKGITSLGVCDPDQKPVKGTFEYHLKKVEEDFWGNRFPTYARWKKRWWNSYLRDGGFNTLTGFRIEGVYRRNEVINYPVQGSAFHCLLLSCIKVNRRLRKERMRSFLVGQIHDSMLGDVVPAEIHDFLSICKEIMTVEVPREWGWINIPLEVEAEVSPIGRSWFDKEVWVDNNGVWSPKSQVA